MALYAFIIGIEKYSLLPHVAYAEADAQAIRDVLRDIGGADAEIRILLATDATKTAIEGDFPEFAKEPGPDDILFFFFAGHGTYNGSSNFLAAQDSRRTNTDTWVRMQAILFWLKECRAKRKVIFLDACHAAVEVQEGMREDSALHVELDAESDVEFFAGFASCRKDESSWSSGKLKHGIWTFHLLQALRGEVASVLVNGKLDAHKLQTYLLPAVRKSARELLNPPQVQRPMFFGNYDASPVLADLGPILDRNRKAASVKSRGLRDLVLVKTELTRFDGFPGYNRYHSLPDKVSDSAHSWAGRLSQEPLKEHTGEIYGALKAAFRWKRGEGNQDSGTDGATVWSEGFEYTVSVQQDQERPSMVLWLHELKITSDELLQNDAFNQVFASMFDTIEVSFGRVKAPLNRLIDELEDADFVLDYEGDESPFSFKLADPAVSIRVELGSMTLKFRQGLQPRELVAAFESTRAKLAQFDAFAPLLGV